MVTKQRNFKMEWAEIHLNALKEHLSALLSKPDNLYRISTHEDAEKGFFFIGVEYLHQIELLKLGLFAGDFVCNLRASLDHLAWELAKIGQRRPSHETCFPVCAKDRPSTQAKIISSTGGWPIPAIARVKDFQPYTLRNSYKSHHLWKLNYLWNLDKHRNTALHSIQSETIFSVAKGVPVEERKFDDRATVKIPLSAKDKVRFNPRPIIQAIFGDEERGIKMTIEDLGDMYEFVSREVMPAFSRFIP